MSKRGIAAAGVSGTAGAACEAFSKAVTGPIFFA
jgi:hypothetical protein